MGSDKSKVIIQTYNPEDKIMRLIEKNDMDVLYSIELENRKITHMPPFGKIVSLALSSFNEKEVFNFGKILISIAPKKENIKILGPIQPSLYKLRSRYRIKIYIFSLQNIQSYVKTWLNLIKIPSHISISIDVDPYDFS
jgi:primosomal protein N' (replication factor Y)